MPSIIPRRLRLSTLTVNCRFKDTPPSLCFILIFLSLICILFQILIAQSTISRHSSFVVHYMEKLHVQQAHPPISLYDNKTIEALRRLDDELRSLVYQEVLSVETFTQKSLQNLRRIHGNKDSESVCKTLRSNLIHRSNESKFRRSVNSRLPTCDNGVANTDLQTPAPARFNIRNSVPAWSESPLAGGRHSPIECQAKKSVLLVIPYRNRSEHLDVLLQYLHPLLQAQKICYRIVVGEQFGTETFNKGKLMNAVFLESLNMQWFDCVIYHDVDLLPQDLRIPYYCPTYPRHMSVAVDKFNFSLPYKELIGGVLAFSTKHFFKVNGYSNMFWGWGAEDDDMAVRISAAHLLITRADPRIARYTMIKHQARHPSLEPARFKLLFLSAKRYRLDGLNNIDYRLVFVKEKPLFTHIMIDVGNPPPSASYYYSN